MHFAKAKYINKIVMINRHLIIPITKHSKHWDYSFPQLVRGKSVFSMYVHISKKSVNTNAVDPGEEGGTEGKEMLAANGNEAKFCSIN